VNPLLVLGVGSGTLAAAGAVWLWYGFTSPASPAQPAGWAGRLAARVWSGGKLSRAEQRRYRLLAASTIAAGVVVWLVSGLPVLGLVAAGAVPGVPWLLAAGSAERRQVARLEAVAEWTRRLRDVAGVGTGLQSAIVSAAGTAPAPIAAPVGLLAARLQAGMHGPTALRRFAEHIADPTCDQVVAALLLHLADRGDRLGTVLSAIAHATAKEVGMRKEADAERASARFSIRFMAAFAVAAVTAATLAGDYMAPYATGLGQVVMAVLASAFIATLYWVRALTRPAVGARLLRPVARGAEP
jgi:Flp pilus assembly protein TadB